MGAWSCTVRRLESLNPAASYRKGEIPVAQLTRVPARDDVTRAAPRGCDDEVCVPGEYLDALPCRRLPDPYGSVVCRRGNQVAVSTPCHGTDRVSVSFKHLQALTCL